MNQILDPIKRTFTKTSFIAKRILPFVFTLQGTVFGFAESNTSSKFFSQPISKMVKKQSTYNTNKTEQCISISQLSNDSSPTSKYIAQNEENISQDQIPVRTSEAQLDAFESKETGPVINFNNVQIVEFLRFVSRLTGRNFIFDPQELDFPVTIISETPASIDDVMAALLQNLRIHQFLLSEQGNSFIIHRNREAKVPARLLDRTKTGNDIATHVLQISNVDATRVASIIQTMTSPDAIVEVIEDNSRIVVTDITANIAKIIDIVKKLDSPNAGLEIGQYIAINSSPIALISVVQRILQPLAGDKPLVFVPYSPANSVYIVATPFLVEKSLSLMQSLDLNTSNSGKLDLDALKFDTEKAKQEMIERQRREQVLKSRTQPLNSEELEIINTLSPEQLRSILREKGYENVENMSFDEALKNVKSSGLSQAQKEKFFGKKELFGTSLPLGQVESTQFLIHKLQYRKAEDVARALQAIAITLSGGESKKFDSKDIIQSDLIVSLNSIQTIEDNNSLVFTGSHSSLQKVKDLIAQIDVPVRQVFIEALIIDTTISNSLNFGVEWAGKIQRGNFAAGLGMITNGTVRTALDALGMPDSTPTTTVPTVGSLPFQDGLSAGSIGRKIKFRGRGFRSTAALIDAVRRDKDTNIMLNPKIMVEHNIPAEIFVGEDVPILGQSIVNASAIGSSSAIVSRNFETRRTGVSLKVTPLIGANDIVTLLIEQTISSADSSEVKGQGGDENQPPATVRETKTVTRVHLPSDYFLAISGIITEDRDHGATQVPCLGALPLIGTLFSHKDNRDKKRNLLIFIRPKIIDTPIDIEEITKKQQDMAEAGARKFHGIQRNISDIKELLNIP